MNAMDGLERRAARLIVDIKRMLLIDDSDDVEIDRVVRRHLTAYAEDEIARRLTDERGAAGDDGRP